MRRAIALLLLVLPLTACSSDPEQDYCNELSASTAELVGLATESGEGEQDYLQPALQLFEGLREAAPAELRDEWDTFVFAWNDLVDVVKDTGVDPTTFDPAQRPEGMSQADFDRIRAVGAELGSPRVRDAVDGITVHAQDVCGLSLDL